MARGHKEFSDHFTIYDNCQAEQYGECDHRSFSHGCCLLPPLQWAGMVTLGGCFHSQHANCRRFRQWGHQVVDYHALVRGRWHYHLIPKAIFLTDPMDHPTQFFVVLMTPNAWNIVVLVCKNKFTIIAQKLIISLLINFIEFIQKILCTNDDVNFLSLLLFYGE